MKNLRFRTTQFFMYQNLSFDPEEKSLGVLPSLWIGGTAKIVWEVLNSSLRQKVLLCFLNKIDILRNS